MKQQNLETKKPIVRRSEYGSLRNSYLFFYEFMKLFFKKSNYFIAINIEGNQTLDFKRSIL